MSEEQQHQAVAAKKAIAPNDVSAGGAGGMPLENSVASAMGAAAKDEASLSATRSVGSRDNHIGSIPSASGS